MTKLKYILVGALLVVVDQLVKLWALDSLAAAGSIPVVSGVFSLTYVENPGAAFGILQNHTGMLSILTALVLLVILVLFFNGRFQGRVLQWSIIVGVSGGLGNLIDRMFRGFVVDYLDFSSLFGFPVFNFADMCVVCGTFTVLLCIFFYDQKHARRSAASDDAGVSSDAKEKEA